MKEKKPPQVYLVEDVGNSPGTIYAVFSSKGDAYAFAAMLDKEEDVIVLPRTLFYGQPPIRGFNQ